MIIKLRNLFKFLLRDRVVQISFIISLVAFSTIFYFFGPVCGLAVYFTYFCGYFTFGYIYDYRAELTSAVSAAAKTFRSNRERIKEVGCKACGDKDCTRERIIHRQKPWHDLFIPAEIDQAIDSLLERTLSEFVGKWYEDVSVDDGFPAELRYSIRYSASVILSKVLKVNMSKLMGEKLLSVLVKHFERVDEVKAGRQLRYHPAVYSRQAEMDYLRLRVQQILPLLLEKPVLHCRLLNNLVVEILCGWVLLPLASIADPAVPNSLLLLLLTQPPLPLPARTSSSRVQFLSKFAHSSSGLQSNSALMADMCSIMKDKSLLCWFMEFLKEQGSLHILQFCLDVEEFNKRMLSPELKAEDVDTLYKDAWDIYSVYFSPHSPDNIGFSPSLVLQMRKVLSKDVSKLRTSPPLFQAYEHAYSLLDKVYCPLFHTSDEFYTWLCGPRTTHNNYRSGSRRMKRNEGTVLKLTSKVQKIKGAFRSQTLDGQTFQPCPLPLEAAAEYGEELSEEDTERDMSGWKIKIIGSETKADPTTGKPGLLFIIQVEAWAPEGAHGSWTIERRITDFYLLEAKLSEFHGEFCENKLPVFGVLPSASANLPQILEGYIEKLLRNPGLRGSEMLHWFLTSPVELFMEENNIGRLLKRSVVGSLRKERGQNLDAFISVYMASAETKSKSKLEWKDANYELSPRRKRCLTGTVFKDNLSINLDCFPTASYKDNNWLSVPSLTSPSDSFLYLGRKVLKLPEFLLRVALCLVDLLRKQVDLLICYYIQRRISLLLYPSRIAHLISLLQWLVFDKKTKSDPEQVARLLSEKISKMKGYTGNFYSSMFQAFQQPMLNKHLFYNLLDVTLDELFPELHIK